MINLHNIGYTCQGNALLSDVSWQVTPGKLYAIGGCNGAGKSTLLRIISGDLQPTRGSLKFNGLPLKSFSSRRLAERRAVLPQQLQVAFDYTAFEVAAVGRLGIGSDRSEDTTLVWEALKETQVDHLAHRSYAILSGGEQQRVQLARVLAQLSPDRDNRSQLLLLDEPVSALDICCQHQIMSLLRRWLQYDLAVVVILHDLNLIARYADHILWLAKGKVTGMGTADEVLTEQHLEKTYNMPFHLLRHQPEAPPVVLPDPHKYNHQQLNTYYYDTNNNDNRYQQHSRAIPLAKG